MPNLPAQAGPSRASCQGPHPKGPEHFQRWILHILSWQPVPSAQAPPHLQNKQVL